MLRVQPNHVHALLARAEPLQQLGRHAEAIDDLTALLTFFAQDANLYIQRARSYDALDHAAQAAADRKKASEITMKSPRP